MPMRRTWYVGINLRDLKTLILLLVVRGPMPRYDVSLKEQLDFVYVIIPETYYKKAASYQYSVVFEFPKVRPCILRYLRILSLMEAVDGRSLSAIH